MVGKFYSKVAVKNDRGKCSTSSNFLFLGDITLAKMPFHQGIKLQLSDAPLIGEFCVGTKQILELLYFISVKYRKNELGM